MIRSWKLFTARKANRVLGRSGVFWQREYYDRLIREDGELDRAIQYVLGNPERAALKGWNWLWCAGMDTRQGQLPVWSPALLPRVQLNLRSGRLLSNSRDEFVEGPSSLVLVAKRIDATNTAMMTGTTTNGEAMCMVQAPCCCQINKSAVSFTCSLVAPVSRPAIVRASSPALPCSQFPTGYSLPSHNRPVSSKSRTDESEP